MITQIGLALKNVSRGAQKVNVVNYFEKSPPLTYEYYYEEDTYAVNYLTVFFIKCPRFQL